MSNTRKLSIADFRQRVSRVDARFAQLGHPAYGGRDKTRARPFVMTTMGFGWIYLVAAVSNRRDHIEHSLKQGSLPTHLHDWIFSALAVMLAASIVLLLLHVLRYCSKSGGKKKNSGGILFGAMVALTLYYTPAEVWHAGYGMLDGNSQQAILTASAALDGIDLGSVAFVSSQGN